MRELIESVIRSGVYETGRGKYVEGSIRMSERNWKAHDPQARIASSWYVRFQVERRTGQQMWYGAEFNERGELTSRQLFN